MIAIDYNIFGSCMKFVALLSGGKDSVFTIMKLLNSGEHELVCLANLFPPQEVHELDSYMYQSVGSEMIELLG